ncbi:hypothetical protein ACIGFK_20380 [Streptomyces sp. NPDC085524]|uniref:hypothetical protein n=1 Tax=Streptomyces sp. NPDC085524 TaxID=3365728 RepID=UPI0037D302E8
MSDNVKYLPPAAIPREGAAEWAVADARLWWAARTPGFFSPAAGGWALAALAAGGAVLTGWNGPGGGGQGTDWAGYWFVVPLFCLPLWFRFLPAAAMASASVVAVAAGISLSSAAAGDTAGRVGACLLLTGCAYAFTGALWRLGSRGRQRELALAAAGDVRVPLPMALPEAHRRRGLRPMLAGGGLCLAAAALLGWGLAQDLAARRTGSSYDAVGQQVLALLLLVPGTPALGRGLTARLAARRLHRGPQPVLRVGVRARYPKHLWLYPDARTTDAPALIAFRDRYENTRHRTRTLVGGMKHRLRIDHHDVNAQSEPFEALLYGVPFEGAEVVLEHAAVYGDTVVSADVTAVPLVPERRNRPGRWHPARTSYRLQEREREREQEQEQSARRRKERASGGSGSDGGSGCGSSSSCGSSCSSSCGGGCGGGD